jgi:hypothetical protein
MVRIEYSGLCEQLSGKQRAQAKDQRAENREQTGELPCEVVEMVRIEFGGLCEQLGRLELTMNNLQKERCEHMLRGGGRGGEKWEQR